MTSGLRISAARQAVLRAVNEVAVALALRVYLVGGVVRDLLLTHSFDDKDLDFIVIGAGERGALQLANGCQSSFGGTVREFSAFLTAKLIGPFANHGISELDFACAREEYYERPGALPVVRAVDDMRGDLARRDFSINAIAIPMNVLLADTMREAIPFSEVRASALDFFGGIEDLKGGIVRVLHARSFHDDPTRIFRAVRYAGRLSGTIEPTTDQLAREAIASGALKTISAQRVVNELRKIARENAWRGIFTLLEGYGVIETVEPFFQAAPLLYRLTRSAFDIAPNQVEALILACIAFGAGDRSKCFQIFGLPKARTREIKAILDQVESRVELVNPVARALHEAIYGK